VVVALETISGGIRDVHSKLQSIPWFALHIRMHDHVNVELSLRYKGYEVFAPSYPATRRVGGRDKIVQKPLFPGYLFCSFDPQVRLPILTVPGVINILGTGNLPAPVEPHEIEAIRQTIDSGLPVEPYRLIQPGEPVRVQEGSLAGLEGVVVLYKSKRRLVISVTALNNRSFAVELERTAVIPLKATVAGYDPPPAPSEMNVYKAASG
jgi:transcription antitermination factor NusG